MTFGDQIYRQNAVKACILSLLKGNAATVTSIGRGIGGDTSDKRNIKRADSLLSNPAFAG